MPKTENTKISPDQLRATLDSCRAYLSDPSREIERLAFDDLADYEAAVLGLHARVNTILETANPKIVSTELMHENGLWIGAQVEFKEVAERRHGHHELPDRNAGERLLHTQEEPEKGKLAYVRNVGNHFDGAVKHALNMAERIQKGASRDKNYGQTAWKPSTLDAA